MEVDFGFINICSFFTIWIFNIYSWLVSAVLCSDGVLSVPATKAFPKSQTLGKFPCKFIFAHFHAVRTEAIKAATLWLCLVWHLIPYSGWHMVAQLGDNQTHVLPPLPDPKWAFAVQAPWGFPQDCREWDVFGLLSHLDSMLIYLPGDKCNIFHSVDSGEDVHPTPCSTAPLSACPVWIHTSWTIPGVKVLAVCLQVHQQTHKSAWLLPAALLSLCWSPTAPWGKDLSYPSKCTHYGWEFHWSHHIKLYRELNWIALSTLWQYTWEN